MKRTSLPARPLAIALMLGMIEAVAACFGSGGAVFTNPGGAGGASTIDPRDAGAGETGPMGGTGDDGAGGANGSPGDDGAREVPDASMDHEAPIDSTTPDDGLDDRGTDAAPRSVTLFSFDTDSDFALCDPAAVQPPCWQSLVDPNASVAAGTIAPIADEAIANHTPARALEWTADYPDFDADIRLVATFASSQDWTGRARVHLNVKVTSGLSSLDSYQLFVQGGAEARYRSIYRPATVDTVAPVAGEESEFRELIIDFTGPSTDLTVLPGVSGLGILLHSVNGLSGNAPVPPPTVLEVDNIWLE